MARRTPFYDKHIEAGGRMVEFAGFDMPIQYEGIRQEHAACRSAAGLFDVSHMGEVFFRGPKAVDALDWLLSNNVRSVEVGQAQYNLMCNKTGGVVDDVVIYRLGEQEYMVCVNAANREKDFAWMVENNPCADGVEILDEGDAWAQIAIQGRQGQAILGTLTDIDLSALAGFRLTRGTVAGVDGCIIARTGYTGEDGFEVFIPAGQAPPVWDAVVAAGEPLGLKPVGLGARDTLRLEVRYSLYGHELTDETHPIAARLGWVTKLTKEGGFLGADVIAEQKPGLTHMLAGVVIDGKRIPREGYRVLGPDGQDIGWVTSGTKSPSLGYGVALCYVQKPFHKIGTELVIDVRGRQAPAKVVKGPFYQRDY